MKYALIIILIILSAVSFYLLYWHFKYKANIKEISNIFCKSNCIVYGRKGCGKDLIFNAVINNRNTVCFSNIMYNKDLCVLKSIQDFSVYPNTFINMLEQNIIPIKKDYGVEGVDMYISDGGIYLPSQYSQQLVKQYPSLPIYYALSRHLANMNIHINTQYLGRVWDKLREQADGYFKAVETKKSLFGKSLITEVIYYDTYKSAMAELLPYKKGLIDSKEDVANMKDFEAKNGIVKRYFIKQKISDLKYDTRYFHKVFYDVRSPDSL